MSIKLKPLGNRVAIEKLPAEETSKGGIILTNRDQDAQSARGKVIAVGPGKENPVQVNVNDVVFFSKFSGTEVGESVVLMSEEDILAVEA